MNGGYIMIYKNSKRIYLELFACLTLGKPILWYEDKNTCFFIDTISGGEISTEIVDDEEVRTYGDIILTKGGMTITITAENVVSEVGEIQPTSGSSVVANPTLSGDEESLTGLEVDGVKYAVASGGGRTLYNHNIVLKQSGGNQKQFNITIISSRNTAFDLESLAQYLYNYGYTSNISCISIIPLNYAYNFRLYSTNGTSLNLQLQSQSDNASAGVQSATFVSDTFTII